MVRRWGVSLAGLALVTVSLAAAGPAIAVSSAGQGAARAAASPPFRPGGVFPGTPVGGHGINYNTGWSGYAVIGGTFTTATASWTQNAVNCTGVSGYTDMSPWIGIDGYSDKTVEQTGSSGDCNGDVPDYYAWYEMYPRAPVFLSQTVQPGDQFTGTVTHTHGKYYKLTLQDLTQGWTYTVTKTISAQDSSAEAVMERLAHTPLSPFGNDPFSNFTVDGQPIGSYTASPYTIERMEIRVKGTLCDKTSALSGNEDFTVTWEQSC
jgi:Peptidase A4 family